MIYYNYAPYYYSPFHRYPSKITANPYPKKLTESVNDNANPMMHHSNTKNTKTLSLNDNTRKSFPSKQENSNISSEDNPMFEIFGIKLYFDDILLICLIFFLYTEGVEDQYLFISLILLLLS